MLGVLKSLSLRQKSAVFLAVDLIIVPIALFCTLAIQENSFVPLASLAEFWLYIPFLMSSAAVIALALGIPQIRLNAYQIDAVLRTGLFAVLLSVAYAGLGKIASQSLLGSSQILFAIMFFLLSAGSRLVMLHIVLWLYRRDGQRAPVLIYGAGMTGTQLASALRSSKSVEVVAFVDDSKPLQGLRVGGALVHAARDIPKLVAEKGIRRVILAMPSLGDAKQAQIAQRLQVLGLEVHALPSFAQLVGDEALVEKLTPISPNSLLGRDHLDREIALGGESYTGKSILVSGAGGSIGSELCRQVLSCRPARLVLYELSEFALYNIDLELKSLCEYLDTEIVPILGSVTDARQVRQVLSEHEVEVVLHAAAYKHVPLVELNPVAGVANNVLGTRTLAKEAMEAGVRRFILVSSDKAVRPSNIMGATKRLAELVIQDLSNRSTTTVFAMVRFGNVLGSSGSVIPLFQDQIARGGPVTITHDQVTRYFMTVQEAVRLVLLAGSFAEGGEVFVLDMGKPVVIRDLAQQLIEASGFAVRDDENPQGDIEIVTIGLRPGEKLHEELLIGEGMKTTPHAKILCAQEDGLSEIEIASALRGLRIAVAGGDEAALRALISQWVEGFGAQTAQDGQTRS